MIEPSNSLSAEKDSMSPERLDEIVDNSLYVANVYTASGRGWIEGTPPGGKYDTQIHKLASRQLFPIPEEEQQKLTDKDVSELVTVAPVEDFDFSEDRDRDLYYGSATWGFEDKHKGEPLYVIQYVVMTSGRVVGEESGKRAQKFPYNSPFNSGRDTPYSYTMFLPKSVAEELGETMQADPQLARDLGVKLVKNPDATIPMRSSASKHTVGEWEKYQPPYEQWRERTNGVARMAFRTGSDQPVERANIVTF